MTDVAVIEARHQPVLRRDIVTDREWPFCSCGHRDCETRQALDALRAAEAELRDMSDRLHGAGWNPKAKGGESVYAAYRRSVQEVSR